MYGRSLYIPTTNDFTRAFQEHREDAQERLKAGKLKLGENVRIVGDHMEIDGAVAIMEVNARTAKTILEKNPDRNFYIEESFRLDWMYPYLSPHGLIMELHHKPLSSLDQSDLDKDLVFWKQFTADLIGNWLIEKTSVKEICNFAEKTYLRAIITDFKGDPEFAKNTQAQMCFSKLRGSIAGLYAWRASQSKEDFDRHRLRDEADFAFRQSFALCPYSPEVVSCYAQFLANERRTDEAVVIAETALRIDPDVSGVKNLLSELRKIN